MSLPPSGEIPQGAIRFNTDSQRLEFYAQGEWWVMSTDTPNLGASDDVSVGARAVFSGGLNPSLTASQEYLNIASGGTSRSFGDLTYNARRLSSSGFSDSTRGVIVGGFDGSNRQSSINKVTFASTGSAAVFGSLATARSSQSGFSNSTRGFACGGTVNPGSFNADIIYFTIQSDGNGVDFGADITEARDSAGGASNSTRGLFISGQTPTTLNNIDYITIQSTGNAVDFGDTQTKGVTHACASPTRAVCVINTDTIEYVEISTLGNSSDFGVMHSRAGMCSNSIRGVCGGGFHGPLDTIEYITIATLGDGTDFGDLTQARQEMNAVSSPTRGVWGGGQTPTRVNTVDYVKIMSLGDALDFGDLTVARSNSGGASNGHGGL